MNRRMLTPVPAWAGGDRVLGALHDQTRLIGADDHAAHPRECSDKSYPRMPKHPLPDPQPLDIALTAALDRRCSARALDPKKPIELQALGQLLHWSAGNRTQQQRPPGPSRRYPSAGARYPLEVYVAARLVDGLPAGLYHWRLETHELEGLPVPAGRVKAAYDALRYPWHRDGAALVVIAARLARTTERYGRRGYRFGLLEAGALLQNLGLVAGALGLAGCAIGTAWDSEIERLLDLDPSEEIALTAFAVGHADWNAPSGIVSASMDPGPESKESGLPFHPALVVPLESLSELAPGSGRERLPGLSALRSLEGTLGVKLGAELPGELLQVPPVAWEAHARLARLAQTGMSCHWRWIANEPDEPRFHSASVHLGEQGRGLGRDADCPAAALVKAISEAVERQFWLMPALHSDRVRIATPAGLGTSALPLESIAGYAEQLRSRHPERLAWTADTEFAWVKGGSLTDGTDRWVPLQLVTAARPDEPIKDEPELRPRVTTGLAAHPERTRAILNGLLEVVERDAFMLTWLLRTPPDVLDLATCTDPRLSELTARLEAARLMPWALALKTDVPVPVVLGLLHDTSGLGPAAAVGAAARSSLTEATRAALTEAFGVWRFIRRAQAEGKEPPADTQALGREERLLWWARPDRWPLLQWLLKGPRVSMTEVESAPEAPQVELDRLLEWFRKADEAVDVVDLTDEALAYQLGHHVVGVVAPGFHPLHVREDRPALWSRRLERAITELGLPTPPTLNPLPHPFP